MHPPPSARQQSAPPSKQRSTNDALRGLFKPSEVTIMNESQASSPIEVRLHQSKLLAAVESAIKSCDVAIVVAVDSAMLINTGRGKSSVPGIIIGHCMDLSQMPLGTIDSILDACAEEGLACRVTACEPELYHAQMPSFREANVQISTNTINSSLVAGSSQPESVER